MPLHRRRLDRGGKIFLKAFATDVMGSHVSATVSKMAMGTQKAFRRAVTLVLVCHWRMISSSDSDMGGSFYPDGSKAAAPSEHTKLSAALFFELAQRAGRLCACFCVGEGGLAVNKRPDARPLLQRAAPDQLVCGCL